MTHSTRLILTGILALAAAFAANCANGGFIRVRSVLPAQGEATLNWSGGLSESKASLGGAGPAEPTDPFPPEDDEGGDRPALRTVEWLPTGDAGGCGSESSAQSTGNGSSSAAIPSAISQVPQTTLTGRLPSEMGPAFSNPPPGAPLRPPRSSQTPCPLFPFGG